MTEKIINSTIKTVALHNLGCKVNQYETDSMGRQLAEAGYEIVPFESVADVYVINTCSVTAMADKKSRQMLHRARRRNQKAVVVAAGCYVQTAEEELKKDLDIDILLGNDNKGRLLELVEKALSIRNASRGDVALCENPDAEGENAIMQREQLVLIDDINEQGRSFEEMPITASTEHTRAFLKVQDGCNQFCSYCIIPYARGRVRSRKLEDVVRETKSLAVQGYKEMVLTGIHLSSYGIDLGLTLMDLIKAVHDVKGVERIRFGSMEPRLITEEFAQELSSLKKVCPHFHLSLQSGCDATLSRMNRKYTAAEYAEGVRLLRKYFDDPAITTDVIVGFPGETLEEFEKSRDFCEKIDFYEMHIFKYSKRQGTRAATMPNQVREEDKNTRSDIMLELTARQALEYRKRYVGKSAEVLLEEPLEINGIAYMTGFTKEYIRLAVPMEMGERGDIVSLTVADEMFITSS